LQDRINPERFEQASVEPRADHRRCAQCALGFRVEAVDAGGDGRLQRGWHADLSSLRRRNVCARLAAQHTALGQVAHHLLGEKRVTGGPLGDLLAQPSHRRVRPEQL